ncbi:hypothetical protein EJ04DRAFT_561632 [Polyplosphaeria fusca]|uniref:Uncharacterized protein n=1 Tax=Polyplosphaeria fusca TaxID=682080 RepID=A0A9P4R1K5_9PLEO|nr:hypothetical protein EJ04DRAFT_561632 [Polyplosphaeria fusca]
MLLLLTRTEFLSTHILPLIAATTPYSNGVLSTLGRALQKELQDFKYMRRKGKMKELESDLQKLQSTMQTRILVNLRQRTNEVDVAQTSKDQILRNFMRPLEAGHTDLDQLLKKESTAIQKHVSDEAQATRQQMQSLRLQDEIKSQSEQLLKSLYFDEMNARYNQVAQECEGTFQWL